MQIKKPISVFLKMSNNFFDAVFHYSCIEVKTTAWYQQRRFKPLKSGLLLLYMGLHYLRSEIWVASGETGHNPDVAGSYQAQGPSFF